MCGIAGIVTPSRVGQLAPMLNAMQHRGPDGEGTYTSPDQTVRLGHRRLAIIDPETGQQPMCNETGDVWVTFNGCIYNYLEIAQSLRSLGHVFKTHSDTEIIVHAYEEYGPECVSLFIGMFAFAVWDERKKELFCARDRVGIKPFYYHAGKEAFVFASEIKAILASSVIDAQTETRAIQDYITYQTSLSDLTFFKDIKKLMPGHTLTLRAGQPPIISQYWDLDFTQDLEHDEAYFTDNLRLLLKEAVNIRLRSDVPLGAHLSGGLDSSTVSSLAQKSRTLGAPLSVFTGAFNEGRSFDESSYARLVAEDIDAILHEIRPGHQDFADTLPSIIRFMDEPAAGPGVFPQFMVSKLASQHVKVVLGGQGGDEIFIGYARYLVGYLEECLKGAIYKTSETAQYAATLSSIIPSMPMLQQYVPMLRSFWAEGLFDPQNKRYLSLMNRSKGHQGIYTGDFVPSQDYIEAGFDAVFNASNAESFVNKMTYFDFKVHLAALLHVEDRTSMAWGLESRVPLLDHRICEFMASIPPTIKFKNGLPKHLFRKAIQNIIPEPVLNREDKMGFPVPLHQWYKKDLKDFVKDVLLDKKAKERGLFDPKKLEEAIGQEQTFGRSIWGALCLELWHKEFIDR